jgi:hypothetical protein
LAGTVKRIHVLTAGFTSQNGVALLMPLLLFKNALRDAGIVVRLFKAPSPALTDCDALVLDNNSFGPRWSGESASVLDEIASYRDHVANLIYMDLFDSAAWPHARALPYVSLYCKSQVLKDRELYLRPLYGARAFTEYYHREFGVEDNPPLHSEPVPDRASLSKLAVSWHSGFADYSPAGPRRTALYRHLPLAPLLKFPDRLRAPSTDRANDISLRVGLRYARPTIGYQRRRLAELLNDRVDTSRLSKRCYVQELCDSKIVLSPFGYGEVCYRDFEAFLCGALLLKPDMSGVETWPNIYRDGETMVGHRWDLSDIEQKLDDILAHYDRYVEIARRGQDAYLAHLTGPDADRLFAEHFSGLVTRGEELAVPRDARQGREVVA